METPDMKTLEHLRKCKLQATDGEFGRVRDILIEQKTWTARWLVADTGDWLLGRKVLISPLSLGEPDMEKNVLPVKMTQDEIESSPPLDEDAPVSRSYEQSYFSHYQWPAYWYGGMLWGQMNHPTSLNMSPDAEQDNTFDPPSSVEEDENPLRSGHELTKYQLVSGEDKLGVVEDLLLNDQDWSVKYIQFDTRKWFHGLTLHVSPEKIHDISWADHCLYTDVSSEELEQVKKRAEDLEHGQESSDFDEQNAQIRAQFGIASQTIS
jgi:hypothetical protein